MKLTKTTAFSSTALATVLLLAGATPVLADDHGGGGGNDRRVERNSGACDNGPGTWKIKAKADDGQLEVEFEVDTNHAGQTWRVRLFDNGTRVFAGKRTTHAPSGSFSLEPRIANRSGKDKLTGRARLIGTDRTCVGSVTF
jgi:hypothetical protein